MFVYLASELTETTQNLEEDELIEIERLTFPQAFDLIRSGGIEDAKTMVGITFAASRFGYSLKASALKSL